jgi:tetratricopeptide (TPR) repeat protein
MNFRRLALSLTFALMAFSVTVFAQEDPAKAVRKANTLFAGYNQDQSSGLDKLEEAKTQIDFATSQIDAIAGKKQADAWLKRTQIYLELAKNPTTKVKYEDALETAFQAGKNAVGHEMAKKFQQVSAAKDLQSIAFEYWNRGASNYELQDYAAAYNDYNMVLLIHDLVEPIDKSADPLAGVDISEDGTTTEKYPTHIQATAFLATAAGLNKEAAKLYEQILANGTKTPDVYNGLFKAYFDTDQDKAMKFLQEGRSAFPENQELLYSEINFYLKNGETEKLEARLKDAIANDPDNKSLYSVLGNTYDNLMKNATDDAKRAELMGKAETYYKTALEKDPEYGDVIYSLGALYYNEAVRYAKLRADLPLNAKKEYAAYSEKFEDAVMKAHPLFLQSERISPSDRSTMIALKELYAQAGKLDITKEYKNRLVKLDNNETIDKPFAGHPATADLFQPASGGLQVEILQYSSVKPTVEILKYSSDYESTMNSYTITCRVKNNTDKLVSYMDIQATFYDKDGKIVGTGMGNAVNLAAGAEKTIKVLALDIDNADKCEVQIDNINN